MGKTALVNAIVTNRFNPAYEPTLGSLYSSFEYNHKSRKLELDFWDTGSQERFDSINRHYLINSHFLFICYAHNDQESFEHLKGKWWDFADFLQQSCIKLLIETKNDIRKSVDPIITFAAQNFAKEQKADFYSTSAKIHNAIECLPLYIAEDYINLYNHVEKILLSQN